MKRPSYVRAAQALAVLSALAVPVLAPVPVLAQEPGDLPAADFGEELAVEVVNVEVYVTDRKGRPVTGLTREDFQLSEDGDPVDVTYFSAYSGAGSGAAAAPAGRIDLGPHAAPAPPAAPRELRHLVVYLDEANLGRGGRRRVLAGLREVIASGSDGADRIMVVVHDGGVRIAQPFTGDRGAVLQTLEELEARAGSGIYRSIEQAGAYRELSRTFRDADENCEEAWTLLEASARQYADRVVGQVNEATAALSRIASALSGVTGRKFVLYVADGLEQRAGIDLFNYAAELCPAYEREFSKNYLAYDLAPAFGRLTAHANANGVTFYTLEAAGLQTDASVTDSDPRLRPSTLTRRLQAANRQSPLFQIANETGGRAVLNANVFGGELERIAQDYGSYYSLGFESHHRGDGRLHRIEVKVAGRGLTVRHRTYYRDKPLEGRLAERVWGTLLLGSEANPLGVSVAAGEARPRPLGCCSVPVEVRVPVDRLSLAPAADSQVGRVYVVMTARSEAGETISVRGREIPVRAGTGEEGSSDVRTLVVDVDLDPGSWELAVGVVDLLGGAESYVRARAEVPPVARETSTPAPRI